MKQTFLSVLFAAFTLLLSGCWNGRLLVAMEEPYWMSEGGNSHLRWPLARASFTHGYLPRFVVIGAQEDAEARLRRELTVRHYRAVVVGPLLSVEPQTYESVSPATRFLLVENPIAVSQSNEVRLVFDRTPSFRTAGYAAGLAVRDEADGAAINALASRIGILLSAHPPGTQDEITAFSGGVAQALDGGKPFARSLTDPLDQNTVRSAIEQMRRDGVEIFLLFTGAADSWALEDMKNSGGSAIVSDWAPSGAFPGQVFLSIETELDGGVARFLGGKGSGEGMVSGPVRIVAGQARPIPSEIAAKLALK
ncbi:MAG: hypothetical protein ABSG38_12650 [Spirochaetia bacterium]|jgi:hypothetical protein